MRIRLSIIAASLLVVFGIAFPRSASALSCIPLANVVAEMDVIVRGQITAIPATGTMDLAVSRYYKGGAGTTELRAQVPGLGQGKRMDWFEVPKVGDELIIGFVKHDGLLENGACNLFVQLQHGQEPSQELQSLIGPGRPTAGQEPPPQVQSAASPMQVPAKADVHQGWFARNWSYGARFMLFAMATMGGWLWRKHSGRRAL